MYAELLCIDNITEVHHELWKYRAKWKLIGMELRIEPGDLEAIEGNNRTVEDALLEVIKLWLRRLNPKPTRTVLTAVTRSKLLVTEAEAHSELSVAEAVSTQKGYYIIASRYYYNCLIYMFKLCRSCTEDSRIRPVPEISLQSTNSS